MRTCRREEGRGFGYLLALPLFNNQIDQIPFAVMGCSRDHSPQLAVWKSHKLKPPQTITGHRRE